MYQAPSHTPGISLATHDMHIMNVTMCVLIENDLFEQHFGGPLAITDEWATG